MKRISEAAPVVPRSEVMDVIRAMLTEVFEVDASRLAPDTRFSEDLELDSLHVMALMAEIEDRVAVEFDVRELAEIATVGQVVDLTMVAMGPSRA